MGLSKNITLIIKDYEIKLDKEIKFYENDTVNLCFSILEYGIEVKDRISVNKLMPIQALKSYMLIETPKGVDYVESTIIKDNKIVFNLGTKYSQFVGIGRMQIVIKDSDGCRITLPEFDFEIKESIYTGWETSTVLVDEGGVVITDELGRPIDTIKLSEMDETNEVTAQTYTMVINEDGNKKIKLDTIIDSIGEMIEFNTKELDRKIDELKQRLNNVEDVVIERDYIKENLVFDLNLKKLNEQGITSSITEPINNVSFNINNNTEGQRNTDAGLLQNGNLEVSAKDSNLATLLNAMDNCTDGITIEYFGNNYPNAIIDFYNVGGLNISNETSYGFNSGFSMEFNYINTNDEIVGYSTGTYNHFILDDGSILQITNPSVAETMEVNKYVHGVWKISKTGEVEITLNGYKASLNSNVATDFKRFDFANILSDNSWFYACSLSAGANTTIYSSSVRIYNKLLTDDEILNNKKYELKQTSRNISLLGVIV